MASFKANEEARLNRLASMTDSRSFSASTNSRSWTASSRRARIATCWIDSSPVA